MGRLHLTQEQCTSMYPSIAQLDAMAEGADPSRWGLRIRGSTFSYGHLTRGYTALCTLEHILHTSEEVCQASGSSNVYFCWGIDEETYLLNYWLCIVAVEEVCLYAE